MFWRKKEPEAKEPKAEESKVGESKVGESKVEKPKGKELHPREIVRNRVVEEAEKLAPGEVIIYKLPEFYHSGFGAFLIFELNPSYPGKGKKYLMSIDQIVDGKPAGKKSHAGDTNSPVQIGDWVATREGLYGSVTRFQ